MLKLLKALFSVTNTVNTISKTSKTWKILHVHENISMPKQPCSKVTRTS